MKSKLLLIALVVVLVSGGSALAQDPGVADTVELMLTVDTLNMTAEMELWVWSDETIVGATVPFGWITALDKDHFQMDSALSPTAFGSAFEIGPFYFESNDVAVTNANDRFYLAVTAFGAGWPADPSGRRLWATYYMTLTQWDGWDADGILVDSAFVPPGSEYLFVAEGQVNFYPHFAGLKFFGDPSLDAPEGEGNLPETYSLSQNYPNPFNPTTEINFDLPQRSKVRLTVYNILGQEVKTLADREMEAGKHVIQWDAGEQATGVYFYKLEAGEFTETRKMMLLK